MKRAIKLSLLASHTREFVIRWRIAKNYPHQETIDICDCLEILLGSSAHHHESILSGTYNHTLEFKEIQLGYDGDELLEILVYYLEQYILEKIKRISAIVERERG